jgi:hypothetical protein
MTILVGVSFYSIPSYSIVSFAVGNQIQSMIQVLNGEVDVAVVNNDFQRALDNASWYNAIGSGDLRVLPSYLVPLAPIFNLPVR